MKQWMYQLYFDKEEMLKTFYETKKFPHTMFDRKAGPPKEMMHEPRQFWVFNAFYLVSTFVFWTLYRGNSVFGTLGVV